MKKLVEKLRIQVDYETITLYVNDICHIMEIEPQRITNKNDVEFLDTQTNVLILVGNDEWSISIPGSKSFVLASEHIKYLRSSLNKRENNLLLEIHEELYEGEKDVYKTFKKIQKMRKTSIMTEEAYQNLLTVYALNMDGDTDVS